jgi:hypothetical protein
MARGSRIVVEFAADTSKLDKAFASVKSGSSGIEKAVKGVAAGAAFGLVAAQIGDAIQAASSLNESMSKSANVFGANAAAIDAWAQQGANDFGLSKQAALEAASSFGNMFSQLGISSDKAAQLSQNMVELAADFASFHNAKIEDVITAQSAAFRGEYDSLQRFLPLINAATVEQEAMAMTGEKNKSALTAQQKALAVNNLMMKGAGAAAGDFDRTSDSLANQQRVLAANIENTQAIIGQKLQPVMNDVLQWMNSDGIPGFIHLTRVVGEGMADAAGFFVGGMADIASAVAQVLEKVDQFIPGMEGIPEQLQRGVVRMREMEAGLHDVRINLDFATGAAADHAAAQAVAAKAMDKTTRSTAEQTKAVAAWKDAQLDARSADLALEGAKHTLSQAQAAYNNFLRTGGIDIEKVTKAQEGLARANKNVEEATKDVAKAQEAVNEALKPATQEEWLDNSDKQGRARNDLTLAELDAKDATEEYLRVMGDAKSTEEDKTRAWVAADTAARNVTAAQNHLNEVTKENTELGLKGTTQTTAYKDAVTVLHDKQEALTTALVNQKTAQQDVNEAQSKGKTYADDLWQVTHDLAVAQLDLDTKTQGVKTAHEKVKTTFDDTKTSVRDLWSNVVGLKEDLASGWSVDPALNALVAGPVLPGQSRWSVNPAINPKVAGPVLPKRAAGGSVAAGRGYLVGEMGPEMFVPNRGGTIVPNGAVGGTTLVINFNGVVGDRAAAAREIQSLLLEEQRKSGRLGLS